MHKSFVNILEAKKHDFRYNYIVFFNGVEKFAAILVQWRTRVLTIPSKKWNREFQDLDDLGDTNR